MKEIEFDSDDLEKKLAAVFVEIFLRPSELGKMPMYEVRARAERAGAMFGLALAACMHEGKINADMLMELRVGERVGKERFVDSVIRLLAPGGQLREAFGGVGK